MAGPWRCDQRPVAAGEDALGAGPGDVAHLVEDPLEGAAVGDPLLIEGSVVDGEHLGDCLARFLPGDLPVRAVALVGVGAAAVGVLAAGVALDQRALAGEPDLGEAGLRGRVVGVESCEVSVGVGRFRHRPVAYWASGWSIDRQLRQVGWTRSGN